MGRCSACVHVMNVRSRLAALPGPPLRRARARARLAAATRRAELLLVGIAIVQLLSVGGVAGEGGASTSAEWSEWRCSGEGGVAGGVATRNRTLTAMDCQQLQEEQGEETPCTPGPQSQTSYDPVVVQWLQWSEWEPACGSMQQSRTRLCVVPEPDSDDTATAVCYECGSQNKTQTVHQILSSEVVVPCCGELPWGQWSEWGPSCDQLICSPTAVQDQSRERECSAVNCPQDCSNDTRERNVSLQTWGEWSPWSSGMVLCAEGQRSRARRCERSWYDSEVELIVCELCESQATETATECCKEAWQWSDWSKEPVILPEQQQQADVNTIPCDEQNATTHRTCVLNTSHLNSTFNSSSGTNNTIIGVSCQFCSPGAMETKISPLPPGENCNSHSNVLVGSLAGLTGVAGLCTIVGLVFACLCCREWQRRMSYSVSAEARKRSNGDTELDSHFVQHDVNEEELPPFVSLQQEEGTEQPMMSEATESISTNKQMKGEAPHNQSSAASDLTAQSSKTNLLEGDELNMADSGLSWL